MNEVEIIKTIKNMLLHAETQLLDYEALAIQGLLELYDKEKQKNKKLENTVKAQEMEHEYDVNMIDKVKGECVKLYNIIDLMAKDIIEYEKDLKYEDLYKDEREVINYYERIVDKK